MARFLLSVSVFLLSFALQAQVFDQVRLFVNSHDGVYQKGDTVKVTARKPDAGSEAVLMEVLRYGKVQDRKEMVLDGGETEIFSGVFSEPVSVMVKLSPLRNPKISTMVGFLVAPEEFRPGFAVPDDLRAFWDGELARMRALKPKVKQLPAVGVSDEDAKKFECYKIEINMPEGNPCRGYIAYPRDAAPGSLPIYLAVHAAGVKGDWTLDSAEKVLANARKGYLAVDINAHGFLSDQPEEYYDNLNKGELKDYSTRDFHSISDYYFHNMYLRDVRGLDYAVTLPVWDGKRILVHGESQGGGQALALSGIDTRITHAVAIVPALTDMGACLDGRKSGWPEGANRKYAPTPLGPSVLAYHDGAVLVSLFKGRLYVEAGNTDLTCDPAAVSAGFNNAKSVQSREIRFFPWRTHNRMEERVKKEWNRDVMTRREAFFNAYLSGTDRPGTEKQPVTVDTVLYLPNSAYPAKLLILRPTWAEGPLPCIVFVPGSAWKKQNMAGAVKRMIPMAERGYVVACAEYRPCSEALFPAQAEDAKTATRYMRAHAAEYGVDPERICAWGSSSGGHTVLLQALTQDSSLLDNRALGEWSCKVRAVVDYYGPSELVREFRIENGYQRDPDANGGLLLGDPVWEKRDVALKASPLYYVHPYAVPLLIVHGDKDKVVPLDQSDDLAERYRACGAPCEYLVLPGEGHGTAGFWTPEMYDKVDSFLRKALR